MDKIVFEANKKIEEKMYLDHRQSFYSCINKSDLLEKYKDHELRFCLIIRRNIALENNDNEYANFIDSVIDSMTMEISLLNKAVESNTTKDYLKKLTFHEKINIIFYVRDSFYDKNYEPYEVLNKKTYSLLANSIIDEANEILKNYKLTLNDIKKIHPNDLEKIVNDRDLYIDLKFASELIK